MTYSFGGDVEYAATTTTCSINVYGTKEVSVEAIKEDDGRKAISVHTARGGAEDDKN